MTRFSTTRRSALAALMFLCAGLLLAPGQARATDPQGASNLIQSLGTQALESLQQPGLTLSQREAAFAQILRAGFDLDLIGRFVLGQYWRQASEDQRSDYLDAFGDYVIKTYARRLGGFKGQSFSIVGTQHSGEQKDVLVGTRIEQDGGQPILAAWRVREIDGQLRIIDVVVEGVSMAVTQRQEFAAVTRQRGIDGLVQILRAQTERLSASAG